MWEVTAEAAPPLDVVMKEIKIPLLILCCLALCGCNATQETQKNAPALTGENLPRVKNGNFKESQTPPKPVYMQKPVYPKELKEQGIGGVVVIEFVVNTRGEVENPRVIESPHPKLSQNAVAALLKSKFEPGKVNGIPTHALLKVPVTF